MCEETIQGLKQSFFFVTFGLVKYVFVPKANTIVDLVTLMGSSVGQRP